MSLPASPPSRFATGTRAMAVMAATATTVVAFTMQARLRCQPATSAQIAAAQAATRLQAEAMAAVAEGSTTRAHLCSLPALSAATLVGAAAQNNSNYLMLVVALVAAFTTRARSH